MNSLERTRYLRLSKKQSLFNLRESNWSISSRPSRIQQQMAVDSLDPSTGTVMARGIEGSAQTGAEMAKGSSK